MSLENSCLFTKIHQKKYTQDEQMWDQSINVTAADKGTLSVIIHIYIPGLLDINYDKAIVLEERLLFIRLTSSSQQYWWGMCINAFVLFHQTIAELFYRYVLPVYWWTTSGEIWGTLRITASYDITMITVTYVTQELGVGNYWRSETLHLQQTCIKGRHYGLDMIMIISKLSDDIKHILISRRYGIDCHS
jgi:hypothetical protein